MSLNFKPPYTTIIIIIIIINLRPPGCQQPRECEALVPDSTRLFSLQSFAEEEEEGGGEAGRRAQREELGQVEVVEVEEVEVEVVDVAGKMLAERAVHEDEAEGGAGEKNVALTPGWFR